MAEFCKCKSLIVNGNCTNKNCASHAKNKALASYTQIEYILKLCEQLGKGEEEISSYDINLLTTKGANDLIEELLEEIELGED